jgi:hypothetical protein
MYSQTVDYWKEKVETALSAYKADVYNISEGYNVLRYAERGFLKTDDKDVSQSLTLYSFSPENNANEAYKILQAALNGHLEYKN